MTTWFQIHTRDADQISRAFCSYHEQTPKNFTDERGNVLRGIIEKIFVPTDKREATQIVGRLAEQPAPMPKESYVTKEECWQYYEDSMRLRGREDYTFSTTDLEVLERAKTLFLECKPGFVTAELGRGGLYGFVTEIKPRGAIDGEYIFDIRVRPTHYHHTGQDAQDLVNAFNRKESVMKVYEAIVLTTDEKGEVNGVAEVIPAFVAKSTEEAKNIVRVDYAAKNSLSGKDAAALQVRVREFPLG